MRREFQQPDGTTMVRDVPGSACQWATDLQDEQAIRWEDAEDGKPPRSSIQLVRTGDFKHFVYGKIKLTPKILEQLAVSFTEKARGQQLPLDLNHMGAGEAQGWFTRIFEENDGKELWGEVEWTEPGLERVRKRLFRYTSLEFDLNYVDPETGDVHGPTVFGAALTNRPFIKRMEPVTVNFSEFCPQAPDEAARMIEAGADWQCGDDGLWRAVAASRAAQDQGADHMAETITDEQRAEVLTEGLAVLQPVLALEGALTMDAVKAAIEGIQEARTSAETTLATTLQERDAAKATAEASGEQVTGLVGRVNALEEQNREHAAQAAIQRYVDSGQLTPAMLAHDDETPTMLAELARSNVARFHLEMGRMPVVVRVGERGTRDGGDTTDEPELDPTALFQAEVARVGTEHKLDVHDATAFLYESGDEAHQKLVGDMEAHERMGGTR